MPYPSRCGRAGWASHGGTPKISIHKLLIYKAQLPRFVCLGDAFLQFSYIGFWASIPFIIFSSVLCFRFPTNRILFCVGSKRVCGVGVLGASPHVAQAGGYKSNHASSHIRMLASTIKQSMSSDQHDAHKSRSVKSMSSVWCVCVCLHECSCACASHVCVRACMHGCVHACVHARV